MKCLVQVLIAIGLVQSIVMQGFEVTITEVESTSDSVNDNGNAFESEDDTPNLITIDCEDNDADCIIIEELELLCQQYKGKMDGGRCYYSGAISGTDWSQGWARCKAKGGTMAQLHTSLEIQTYSDVMVAAGTDQNAGIGVWMALRRDPSVRSGTYAMDFDLTFWYDSETKYNERLTVGNTWIQVHNSDCAIRPDWQCMVGYATGFNYIGDNSCSRGENAVACMRTTSNQSFRYVKKACINAPEIRILKKQSLIDCARKCAQSPNWCRSFNFYTDGTCRLYSWIMTDRKEKANSPSPDCKHYTYVR